MEEWVRKEWIEALRSGDYQQGRGGLRSEDNKFCCLGVLSDMLGVKWFIHQGNTYYHLPDRKSSVCVGYPPDELMSDIGLSWEAAESLAWMNDAGGKTFAEIADALEEGAVPTGSAKNTLAVV